MRNDGANLQWVEIDIGALTHNFHALRGQLKPGTRFMAVVKKNAYGHGALEISRALLKSGAEYLGVYSLEEALELRRGGIDAPVLIFGPVLTNNADTMVEEQLIATVVNNELAEALSEAGQKFNTMVEVHVNVDTGLHREGVSLQDAFNFINYIETLPNLKVVGLYTHFSSADEIDPIPTKVQLEKFTELASCFPHITILHAANSAATLQFPGSHLDMVRVGIALYGLYPSNTIRKTVFLKPVLSLKAKIIRMQSIPPGEGVSYGLTWTSTRDSMVALIPMGYGYGLSRLLSNRGSVLVRGRRAPIRGVICMDQCLVDVTDIPNVNVGDEATVIGQQYDEVITVDEIADLTNTIDYEIVTRLSTSIPRVYLDMKHNEACHATAR